MTAYVTAAAAIDRVRSGDTVMVGGFGLVGCPVRLLDELATRDITGLTVISNNLGEPGAALGRLLLDGKIRRAVGSYFTSNPDVAAAHQRGDLEVELLPQGTLSEAIRAGGAGIGGFYVPAGAGTSYAEGREERELGGRPHVFQAPLRADVALIRARAADELGNLIFTKSARNFNPVMATAATTVIALVDEVVPTGQLSAEAIVTPHVYVDYVVTGAVA